jgi:hypothetical protein
MITSPGSYKIDEATYHSDNLCAVPSLSRSVIKDLLDCPRKAWMNHPRLNPDYKPKEKAIFDLGHIAHALFLEGIDKIHEVNFDSWRTDKAKNAAKEGRALGKIPLLIESADRVREMVMAAHRQLRESELGIQNIYEEGDSELSYIWNERETWFKVRPDWINKNRSLVLDFKTTGTSADPEEYTRIVATTGLDIQRSLYCRGINAVEGIIPRFIFMIMEVNPPFLCSFIEMDSMYKEMGEQKVTRGIRMWRECLRSKIWPGYPKNVVSIEPKPYHLARWEMKMQEAL